MTLDDFKSQGVSEALLRDVEKFVAESPEAEYDTPSIVFIGKDMLEQSIVTLLEGSNLLLSGNKATGKNILAENLAWLFRRPLWNMSFHEGTDGSTLIGKDIIVNGSTEIRKGPIYECAVNGGFGILDEINMAESEAMSILHSVLDFRKIVDVPGFRKFKLHNNTRFIGTMNYGYMGTKELNEALVSRFQVIVMPPQTEDSISEILTQIFPNIRVDAVSKYAELFCKLQERARTAEISTKSVDLRGIIDSLKAVRRGLNPLKAIEIGVINKAFSEYEMDIVRDECILHFTDNMTTIDIFK